MTEREIFIDSVLGHSRDAPAAPPTYIMQNASGVQVMVVDIVGGHVQFTAKTLLEAPQLIHCLAIMAITTLGNAIMTFLSTVTCVIMV